MNSMSATATPARSAMAMPSPVASAGLVVTANSWPAPPVASSVWAARTVVAAARRVEGDHAPAPAVLDQEVEGEPALDAPTPRWRAPRRRAPARSRRRWPRRRRGRPGRTRVAALAGEQARSPPASRSNTAPRAMRSWTRPGPSSTSTRTASTSHRPAPARQRVGQVQVGRVGVAAEHGGHAALGPPGGGLIELGLREHPDPHPRHRGRGPHRGGEAGHPAAEHEQVELRADQGWPVK